MSKSDKIMAGTNSKSGDEQDQKGSKSSTVENLPGLSTECTPNITESGTISSIPLITASLPTLKCSINYQMRAFDPGEESGNERLTSNNCGSSVLTGKGSCSGLIKNGNKNYKAGSKINKLADMLAKRSQNLVDATQNNLSDVVSEVSITSKTEDTVILNNISDVTSFGKSLNNPIVSFDKTANGNEIDLFRKSRRKSVPNQSCNLNQLHMQSASKSCLDFSKLFLMEDVKPEINALGESMNSLQTDESTKRKSIRKNLKNVELTLLLSEKKRRFSTRNETSNNKIHGKILGDCIETDGPIEVGNKNSGKPNESSLSNSVHSISSTNSRRESRTRQRRSKRLVENSTQTTDIEFITVISPKGEEKISVAEENEPATTANECFRCSQFKVHEKGQKNSRTLLKCQHCSRKLLSLNDSKMHYVNKHAFDDLKTHFVNKHSIKCVNSVRCKGTAETAEKSLAQNKEINLGKKLDELVWEPEETDKRKDGRDDRQLDKTLGKQNPSRPDLKIDVTFDASKKSSTSPRSAQKCSPKEIKTEEQLLEMEMLFYSHLSGNIQENLTNHLDGKMDKNGCPTSTDKLIQPSEGTSSKSKGVNLSSAVTSNCGVTDVQISRAPSPYKTRSKTPNPLPPTAKKFKKLPNWQQKFWEKYNFPTNYRYEHRFWDKNYLNTEKSALYLKDLSCLDIKTQLTLKENVKKLEDVKLIEQQMKPSDTLKFPDYLSLVPRNGNGGGQENKIDSPVTLAIGKGKKQNRKEKEEVKKCIKPSATELPVGKPRRDANSESKRQAERVGIEGGKVMTRRQNSIELMKEDLDEGSRRRKGSLDLPCSQKMILRRQTSADSLKKDNNCTSEKTDRFSDVGTTSTGSVPAPLSPVGVAEITGEWVKPRSYLCGTCCAKFTNLWELEDHKWVSHPNVWCTHYEFEDEKIDKLFQKNEMDGKEINLNEFSSVKLADLYKRYLLPHGSLKTAKLVPNTNFPEKCTKCKKNCMNSSEMHKHMLDCGGDTTWFLTMYSSPMTMKRKWRPFGSRRRKLGRRDLKRNITNAANLRPYHYQHRIRTKPGDVESIQKMLANLPEKRARRAINFDEIKTRSQATIHSNRLLRKRFKSSFTNNFLKMKTLKQKRQLKPPGKKEASSKSTTDTSSETTPIGTPKRRNKLKENIQIMKRETPEESYNESSSDCITGSKKRGQTKKSEVVLPLTQQKKDTKKSSKRKTQEDIAKPEKPLTRSNNLVLVSVQDKTKAKYEILQEMPQNSVDVECENDRSKTRKNPKRNTSETNVPSNEIPIKVKKEYTVKKVNRKVNVTDENSGHTEKNSDGLSNIQNSILLRLRHNTKEKTDLVKRMQKKLKNSKRILEMKETKKCQSEMRRSLRLKSLQGVEDAPDDRGIEIVQVTHPTERNAKMKKSNSFGESRDVGNVKGVEIGKDGKVILENKTSKDVKEINDEKEVTDLPNLELGVRRSFRSLPSRKLSLTEVKMDENVDNFGQNGSLPRKNTKNQPDATVLVTQSIPDYSANKKSSRFQHDKTSKDLENKLDSCGHRCQSLRSTRGKEKPIQPEREDTEDRRQNRNSDLEEMPILAKVEPIVGKFLRKKEQEIPILMPVVDESTERKTNAEKQKIDVGDNTSDTVSFEVVKKRRKTSKEVTPLKIIKKVDHVPGDNESSQVAFCVEDTQVEDVSPKKGSGGKKKSSGRESVRLHESKRIENSNTQKYFLGINPCEIDKGREMDDEDSGSDSEPLITLINSSHRSHAASLIPSSSLSIKEEVDNVEENRDEKPVVEQLEIDDFKQEVAEEFKEEVTLQPDVGLLDPLTRGTQHSSERSKTKKKTKVKANKIESRIAKNFTPHRTELTEGSPIVLQEEQKSRETESTDTPQESTVNVVVCATQSVQSDDKSTRDDSANESKEIVLPERRSRRISKETKATSDFVIDDPLILVDELWSDLDSDSDTSKRRSKKGKKKMSKKKSSEERKTTDVNLEELLRNFGEKKEEPPKVTVKVFGKVRGKTSPMVGPRTAIENRVERKSYKRLSLKLFRFNKSLNNFGNRGDRLSVVKKVPRDKHLEIQIDRQNLPDLPFLATEIKENPVQVIRCHSQKSKSLKKGFKLQDPKYRPGTGMHLKISLPLENINNLAVFNNNHLTELDVEKQITHFVDPDDVDNVNVMRDTLSEDNNLSALEETPGESGEIKSKAKRSEVIDKIFYCEICQTYYYSSSQLKIHKLSNRHKLKEAELVERQEIEVGPVDDDEKAHDDKEDDCDEVSAVRETTFENPSPESERTSKKLEECERINEDTLEMPVLEGPFIEDPLVRQENETTDPGHPQPKPQPSDILKFNQESLKDIQRAIGCTDEEMLILTLLGENTLELENHILDLEACGSVAVKGDTESPDKVKTESERVNGILKVDLKQRMTSALTCLVNKAVINLLQKYENVAKTSFNGEALSLLSKLSNMNRKKTILELDELLIKQNDGESSIGGIHLDRKEPPLVYKYQCTICGSRFEKASTRECHINRSHKGKTKKVTDETPQVAQATAEEDWKDYWTYDAGEISLGSNSQFLCSDCGINFVSPQDVLEHQRLEHQAGGKDADRAKDAGPLQSSTIGSSDEIIEGKKAKRRPKVLSSEELDQQRIMANNELRKLDRKFANKHKPNKIKWGMDALRFTVEKENKMVVVEEEKADVDQEMDKSQSDVKNIDLVPKLNFTRTSNIPEFKVIQKNSLKNRFQKILDNKIKRKGSRHHQQENETDEVETEVMLVPVVVKKKKSKKQKSIKSAKKTECGKSMDVYDFNESETDDEPVTLSHIKKSMPVQTKLKLVKVKEGPSKNKADSTTKDLIPDDYDSEDSLPLSIVKKSKSGEEDDEKDEKTSEGSVEKSEGILEQVEYLIEQLENETGPDAKAEVKDIEDAPVENVTLNVDKKVKVEEDNDAPQEGLRVSLANKLLELQNLSLKTFQKSRETDAEDSRNDQHRIEPVEKVDGELECSQSTFDEEDSMPLVLMSKRLDEGGLSNDPKKTYENAADVSTSASEDVHLFGKKESKDEDGADYPSPAHPQLMLDEENARPPFHMEEKSISRAFETLNGNVIYCRNESMSNFDSEFDSNDDGLIGSNDEKFSPKEPDRSYANEVTEKEDVVIVCSKGEDRVPTTGKLNRKCTKPGQKKKKDGIRGLKKRKMRFPLLSATIEGNGYRKANTSNLNKEVIVRKIWNRSKLIGDNTDFEDDSGSSSNDALDNLPANDESQAEIEKEVIFNKIWSRKRVDYESEFPDKSEEKCDDLKINKTEISDEVVIKCGPKSMTSSKRRKSRGPANESSKETIMRKIWSGKCMFQTKAALKTYDSDVMANCCKENDESQGRSKAKKRGRPSGLSPTKKVKLDEVDNDEDDLDSLLEEIEREQFEKAIRLEFLQLRRSEKGNLEILKEGTNPTMGLFTETGVKHRKDASDKRRKRIRRNVRHPRQSLLKRKKFIKKPIRRIPPGEGRCLGEKTSSDANGETCEKGGDAANAANAANADSKVKNRKHKKHRHKHHHHKHKHKKSRHHKCLMSKHKSRHKCGDVAPGGDGESEMANSFTVLEKMCHDMPNQLKSEFHHSGKSGPSKMDDLLFDYEKRTQDNDREQVEGNDLDAGNKERRKTRGENVYDFADDNSDLSVDGYKSKI